MLKLVDKRWVDRSKNSDNVEAISKDVGVNPLVAQVVVNRGITNSDDARKFLFPDYKHLYNPYLLNDMEIAVNRILTAIGKNEKITIFGDYDVDGVSSTTVMMTYLLASHSNINYYIPHRSEGYGLNKAALQSIKDDGTDLVITVDCGITAMNEVEFCNEIGLDIIVTDHHEASDILPSAIAVINPKRKDNTYPYDSLAGVGVAYKLCTAIQQKLNSPSFSMDVRELLDLVAFGTVADLMPLTDENRTIVKFGLELLNDKENVRRGFKQLISVAGLSDKIITAGHIGFQLAPRINALGRLTDVKPAVHMFLTDNDDESLEIAKILNQNNEERREIQKEIFDDVLSHLPDPTEFKDHAIVLGNEKWHTGIKGIVASNVLEKYYRPIALFTIKGDLAEGSARSIEDFNIKDALDKCSDLLVKYGGHHSAAGMTLETKNLEAFRERFNQITSEMTTEEDLIPKIRFDSNIALNKITFDAVEHLSFLEPFGQANASPSFMIDNATVLEARAIGTDGVHLKMKIQQAGHVMDVIAFGIGEIADSLKKEGVYIDLIGSLDINEYNGKSSLQVQLKDIKVHQKVRDEEYVKLDEMYEHAEETLRSSKIGDTDYFYTKIVGVSFEGRQNLIKDLKTGEEVFLQRQPENIHDKNAIAIQDANGVQLGFLKAKLSKDLSRYIDKGVEYTATITSVTGLDTDDNHIGVNLIVERKHKTNETDETSSRTNKDIFKQLNDQDLFNEIKNQLLGGYDFRQKQIESIMHLMNGDNTAVIMGTGRGKSAIFQSVASYKALREGKTTIIIYPLRALVNDQLSGMQEKLSPLGLNVMKGTGDMKKQDKETMWGHLANGDIDILLTTPEFLSYYQENFEQIKEQIAFIVVDEGHHIGKATTTYRPAYKELTEINERLGSPLFAVMTATCSDETFEVIQSTLPIKKIVIDPAVRSNLTLVDKREMKQKETYIAEVISRKDKTIVYANSREKTVEIAKNLRKKLPEMKDQIAFYHAGLDSEQRHFIERLFRDGKLTTIISTSAFGEGIDIPDIRHVIHYHMTFNEIEFNQESGRCGRDGEKAYVHLLFGGLDERINDFIMKKESPSKQMLRVLYSYLLQTSNSGKYEVAIDLDDMARQMLPNLKDEIVVNNTVFAALNIFKELGFVEFMDSADIYYVKFFPYEGKIELENSLRYQEAMQELEEYLEFASWVLQADSMTLLRSLNRPIYPTKIS